MAISNTNLLIKRSSTTAAPSTLKSGELAYSYSSNTLFLGNAAGTGVVNIGGLLYTQTIDNATSANTAGTLVKRDQNNAFQGALYGNANSATKLLNARNFNVSSADLTSSYWSFDGTAGVQIDATLTTTGVTAGTYGGVSQIPVITVDNKGRLSSAANVSISTNLAFNDGLGDSGSVNLLTGSLEILGTKGITTYASGNAITLGTDTTIARTNTNGIGVQTIGTDLQVSGNLTVTGTTTYVNTAVVQTADSLLQLGINNTVGDVIDIGITGQYNNGSANLATGLVRDAGSKNWYLFSGVAASAITSANTISNNYFTSANTATLYANLNAPTINVTNLGITTANITGDIGVAGNSYLAGKLNVTGTTTLTGQANTTNDLGVGGNLYVTGNENVGGTFNVTGKANTGADLGVVGNIYGSTNIVAGRGVLASNTYTGAYTDGIVVDYSSGQGRISVGTSDGIGFYNSGVAGSALMNLSSSGVITGATWQGQTVGVPYGGTGNTSFAAGQVVIGNGTGPLLPLANVSAISTTIANNYTVTNLTTDTYGRVTSFTTQAIGGLTVPQGGTGLVSATLNGITYGNGTGALGVTAAAGSADQTWSNQILTVTNLGVPVWTSALDGGTF